MLDFLTKMLLDNKKSTKMLKKCLSQGPQSNFKIGGGGGTVYH